MSDRITAGGFRIAESGFPVLQMRGISKSFFGVEVLHEVDFAVLKGEIMGLCGENGAGKSTLMKILAGIYAQDAGEVIFKGSPIRRNAIPTTSGQTRHPSFLCGGFVPDSAGWTCW